MGDRNLNSALNLIDSSIGIFDLFFTKKKSSLNRFTAYLNYIKIHTTPGVNVPNFFFLVILITIMYTHTKYVRVRFVRFSKRLLVSNTKYGLLSI